MTIGVGCGWCNRELPLVQVAQPSRGFRCLFCGFAFAPADATLAPGVATGAMAAHATPVAALTELQSITGDRLRLDQATQVGPVANALPQIEAKTKNPPRHAAAVPTGGPCGPYGTRGIPPHRHQRPATAMQPNKRIPAGSESGVRG